MPTNTPRKIDAVQKTCQILKYLQDSGGAGVTEISEELGFSKSVVHAHLATLNEEDLVVKDDYTYLLGLKFLDIAETVKNSVAKHEIVRDQVHELAEDTGEVVHFGAEENGQVVYVAKSKGESAVETASRVGKRMPMHSTSLGKAILAEFSQDLVEEIINQHGLSRQTEQTITDEGKLHEELDMIKDRGYAVDNQENIPGVRCIGISVSAPNTDVLGALSISGPSERMTDDRIENELKEMLAQAANVIEVNSRYQ
jgi:DNA-binding IclR family transcriptional regulator